MNTHQFRNTANPMSNDSSFEIDGVPLRGVSRVSFDLHPSGIPILRLEVIGRVVVDGKFRQSAILRVDQASTDRVG